jgi:hypothetical protein
LFTLGTRVTAFYDEVYSPAPGMDGATAVLLAPVTTLGSLVRHAVAVPAPNAPLPQSQRSLDQDCARIRLQSQSQAKQSQASDEHTASVGETRAFSLNAESV